MPQATCQNCRNTFLIADEDVKFYERMQVPPPTFCWLCRAQRRFMFRNERNLYKRKSDFSGKEIFSMYPPELAVKVYEKDVWLSDQWDPMAYGRDVDFSRPFLEQIRDVWHAVPLKNLNVVAGTGSDYCNHFTNQKNCYLVFNGNECEDCLYGNGLTHSRDCVDVSHVGKSENCYEGFWLTSCASTFFSSQCENCLNALFCKNCTGCTNCFGCVGLRNKQYHIFNVPYAQEAYAEKLKEFDWTSHEKLEELKKRARNFWLKFPNKCIIGSHNTNVSGNYIDHSKNVRCSFLVREGENLKYCQYLQELPGSKDCYDFSVWGDNNQLVYECMACGIGTSTIKFCLFTQENVRDVEYSVLCSSSADLFGCVGLRKKEYCILNKQYAKGEYHALVEKIKNHMIEMPYKDGKGRVYAYGEYFPPEFSPWAYNETIAFDYFPLTRKQAEEQGFRWRDPHERNYEITKKASQLPDRIQNTDDSLINATVQCAHEGACAHQCPGAYRITEQELRFYRKNNIPLPRICSMCRHYERLEQRSGLALFERPCQCAEATSENGAYKNTASHHHGSSPCASTFETTYAPTQPDIVYCESCYTSEVV